MPYLHPSDAYPWTSALRPSLRALDALSDALQPAWIDFCADEVRSASLACDPDDVCAMALSF